MSALAAEAAGTMPMTMTMASRKAGSFIFQNLFIDNPPSNVKKTQKHGYITFLSIR